MEHHERGLRHKGNVQKRLNELRRRGTTDIKKKKDHALQLMQIEAAALSAFKGDVDSNPLLARQLASASSSLNHLPELKPERPDSSLPQRTRFGEDLVPEERKELVRGRERALDTVAQKLEKKNKWMEAVTAEGDVYYWHRDTLGKFTVNAVSPHNRAFP